MVSKNQVFQKTGFLTALAAKFWKQDISSASERAFPGFFLRYFWLLNSLQKAQLSPKRGVLVHKHSLASCQRCRHSVEPRALTCPFKHSDLIAWSLLRWHPTHKYLWGRLCFVQACYLLSTVTEESKFVVSLSEASHSQMSLNSSQTGQQQSAQ